MDGLLGSCREVAGHVPLVLAGLAVALVGSALLAKAWFVASRLAYVAFVGSSLRAQSNAMASSRREGHEQAWRGFRVGASRLMLGDAVALGALCVVTRGTLVLPGPPWLALGAGILLIVLGIGVKAWATASLAEGTFYWRDFFMQVEQRSFSATGPYRWLSNPMYTVGYAHAYGAAILLGSGAGLAAAVFAQATILLLAFFVERPHLRRSAGGDRKSDGPLALDRADISNRAGRVRDAL